MGSRAMSGVTGSVQGSLGSMQGALGMRPLGHPSLPGHPGPFFGTPQGHSMSSECMAGMDTVGEFQQQARRIEMQLHQQLRDQQQMESLHSQLGATSLQLQMLQANNAERQRCDPSCRIHRLVEG